MTSNEIERAVIAWFNESIAGDDLPVRPLDAVFAQAGEEGEPDVLGYRYRTVMVTLELRPGADPDTVLRALRHKMAEDPHLCAEDGTQRVFSATWRDTERSEKTGTGLRVDVFLDVAATLAS